ncbi:hypothetical protein MMC07_005880 [Pseudocyphellaria aurata]|nr:hypothetical protein [Pseudocyphellaria aurata]
MKFADLAGALLCASTIVSAGPVPNTRHAPKVRSSPLNTRQLFDQGEPEDGSGKGAPFSDGTNHELDLQNPDNLGATSTDSGVVPNLKWSFSDSHQRLFDGGWVREQVVTDLPSSPDLSAAQLHLTKGAIREMHWHRVAEWGYMTAGSVRMAAVDENGKNQVGTVETGDIWYFPKGSAHTVQGLEDQNEMLLVFDDGDFDAVGTTFQVDDWLIHTPKSILARNFGVDESVFNVLPKSDPYILPPTNLSTVDVSDPSGKTDFIYQLSKITPPTVPGGGGTLSIVDSRVFPIATTIAAAVVKLEPGGLRELHWHPNGAEWLYFQKGHARATVFIGSATARTIDFQAGDTAIFPDNAGESFLQSLFQINQSHWLFAQGHYIENTSKNETLEWLEYYKSDRVVDISLSQWLALTPHDIAADVLGVSVEVINNLKKEKQVLLKAT